MKISGFVLLASIIRNIPIFGCSHATVVENVARDREKFNELQTDSTGYMLAEVIWKS
jgi:hypothetical protein